MVNYCQKCGSKVDEGDNFCAYCGAKLKDHTKKTKRAAPLAPPPITRPVLFVLFRSYGKLPYLEKPKMLYVN